MPLSKFSSTKRRWRTSSTSRKPSASTICSRRGARNSKRAWRNGKNCRPSWKPTR